MIKYHEKLLAVKRMKVIVYFLLLTSMVTSTVLLTSCDLQADSNFFLDQRPDDEIAPSAIFNLNLFYHPSPQKSNFSPPIIDLRVAEKLREMECGGWTGGNPMGETVFMRQDYALSFPESLRKVFAAATLSQNYDQASILLGELLETADMDHRWAASLIVAYIAFKDREVELGSAITGKVLQDIYNNAAGRPERLSDYWYLKAINDRSLGRLHEAQ